MKIARIDNKYFVYAFGKVYFITAPYKYFNRMKWAIINAVFIIREDSDCDGQSVTYTDRLTDGNIYHWSWWSYSRVGGSRGTRTVIFDKWYL